MKKENELPKRVYQSPTLKVYGDVREITKVTQSGARPDNNSKTAKTV